MRPAVVLPAAVLSLASLSSPAFTEQCGACSEVSFGGTSALVQAARPTGAAAVDLDGDGWVDLAVAEETAQRVVLYRGQAGIFKLWQTLPVGAMTGAMVTADFNGDRRPDLAVARPNANSVSVFLNQTGGFTRTDWAFAAGPASLLALDLDGDSRIDLAAACSAAGGVAIRHGIAGGFGPVESLPTGAGARSLAAGDLNADGRPDLVAANGTASTISVLLNGPSGYLPAASFPAPSDAVAVVVDQLAGDAALDVAVLGNAFPYWLLDIRPGTGDGGLGPALASSVFGGNAMSLLAHDLDVDGDIDLLVGEADGSKWLRRDGAGWASPVYVGPAASAALPADVRRDGIEDVIAVDYHGDNVAALDLVPGGLTVPWQVSDSLSPWFVTSGDFDEDQWADVAYTSYGGGTVYLQRGDGRGGLGAPTAVATVAWPRHITAGDVNGDGHADLVVTASYVGPSPLTVLYGTGAGSFTSVPVGGSRRPIYVALADLNGDARLDLVTANSGAEGVSVFLASPSGGFLSPRTDLRVSSAMAVAIADFNGDGRPDVAAASYDGDLVVLPGDGTGDLGVPLRLPTYGSPRSLAAGDLDGDGDADLACVGDWTNRASIFLGDGQGGFGAVSQVPGGGGDSLTIVDVSGDGRPDLVSAGFYQASLSVLVGTGGGSFESQTRSASPWMQSLTVIDLDNDGKPDVVGGSTRTVVMRNTRCEPRRLSLAASFPTCGTAGVAPGAAVSVRDDGGNLVCSSEPVDARRLQAGVPVTNGLGGQLTQSPIAGIATFGTLTLAAPGFNERLVFQSSGVSPAQTDFVAALSPGGLIEGPTSVLMGGLATFRVPSGASGYSWWLNGVEAQIAGPLASFSNLPLGTHIVEAAAHATCGGRASRTLGVHRPGRIIVQDAVTSERQGSVVVRMALVGIPSGLGPIQLRVRTEDGTARAGLDYVAVDQNVFIGHRRTQASFQVSILSDRIRERAEAFAVRVELVSGPAVVTDGEAVITISPDVPWVTPFASQR
jgi:hypothetical protein